VFVKQNAIVAKLSESEKSQVQQHMYALLTAVPVDADALLVILDR
jgi:hypothetical protein